MRIGICLRAWGERGGIGTYTRNVVSRLVADDEKNEYVLFHSEPAALGSFAGRPNVREVLLRAPFKGLWDQVAVPQAAAREDVDVVFHTKFSIPLFTRRGTLMVVHGTERFVYPQFSHRSDLLYFRTVYPLYLRRATRIIAVSENAKRDVVRFLGLDPAKIRTIYLAPSGVFRRIEDEATLDAARAKYDLPRRFILNVANIYPGKNIPSLLRALKRVREEEDVKLVLAGFRLRLYEQDLALIDTLGLRDHVILLGHVPHEDLVALYNLAEAFVFPSYYESFGMVIVEAQACGCPVVASRGGGAPEAGGEAARYVDPHAPDELARAMLEVLQDPALRGRLVEEGYRNAARFSWAHAARETLGLLEEIGG